MAMGVALVILVAGKAPQSPEEWERQGDASLAAGNYKEAIGAFEAAAETSIHPSRLAAKKGVAYFHIGRYRDAERAFASAVEGAVDADALARAYFNLGTTLLFSSEGQDAVRLADAIRHLRRSLQLSANHEELRFDAGHNLELAKLLWKRANKDGSPPPEPESKSSDGDTNRQPENQGTERGAPGKSNGATGANTSNNKDGTPMGSAGSSTVPGAGRQPVHIPESEQYQPLSPAEARELLRQASERIARERRALQKGAANGGERGYPDW
jgi:tetratricopeptide (TPR) repeat protein